MTKFKNFANGMQSIILPRNRIKNVLEKYPSTFTRNDVDAIKKDWIIIGKDIENGIKEYEKSKK